MASAKSGRRCTEAAEAVPCTPKQSLWLLSTHHRFRYLQQLETMARACKRGPHCKHSQPLEAEDVWRMKVEGGRARRVGIAGEGYDVERHGETVQSTAYVWMHDGTTNIWSKISQDGEYHVHDDHLKDHHLPKTLPYGLPFALSRPRLPLLHLLLLLTVLVLNRRLTTRRVLVLVLQQMGRRTIPFNPRKRRRGSLSQSLPQSLSPSVGSTPSSTGLVASCSRSKVYTNQQPSCLRMTALI